MGPPNHHTQTEARWAHLVEVDALDVLPLDVDDLIADSNVSGSLTNVPAQLVTFGIQVHTYSAKRGSVLLSVSEEHHVLDSLCWN